MFSNFKNTRLGKYYSSVSAKYGSIAPIVVALLVFMALTSIDYFGIVNRIKDASKVAYIVTIVVLAITAAIVLYYMVTKLVSKKISGMDFMIYVDNILAVLMLIELLVIPGTTVRTVLYVVGLVLVVAFTIARMAIAKPATAPLYEEAECNATVKTYCKAFFRRFNLVVLAAAGIALFSVIYLLNGAGLTGENGWKALMIIALVLLIASIVFAIPGRIRSRRMGQVDAIVAFTFLAALLYIIPLCLSFTVFKLVALLVVLAVLAFFLILMIKNTYIEEPKKVKTVTGRKGFGVYFKQLAGKYNLIFAALLGVIAFAVMYAMIAIGVLDGVKEIVAGGFYIALSVAVVFFFASLVTLSKRRRVGANDLIGFALCVFTILAIVPTVQFYSLYKLLCWIVLAIAACVLLAIRITSVVEVVEEDVEVYNPKQIFSKENCAHVYKGVKTVLTGGEKDAHYISNKESRRIAKENMKVMKEYEARKRRKNVPEEEYVTKMKDDRNIVEFENLNTYFFSDAGVVKAVNGVTFSIPQGSTVGVIGESGCGKSVTSLSLMQLVQAPKGQVMEGSEIRFKSTVYKQDENGKNIPVYEVQLDEEGNEMKDADGNPIYVTAPAVDKKGEPIKDKDGNPVIEKVQKRDVNGIPLFETEEKVYNVAKMPTEVMRKIRGREITMIFQEPMTSLNPIFTIGDQLDEVVLLHIPGATKESAKARTYDMLKMVGIIPENVYKRYPHELSGGMRQRVMIAMALSCNPKLIIADEPTTALDVTIQAQILDLLREVKQKINGSIMFITHDLGVIAEMADYVVVMYAGRVIEMGTAKEIFDNPMHPYTMGLQKSKPAVNKKVERLYSIPGSVPNPINMPNYCYFRDRCDKRCDKCNGDYPDMIQVSPTHKVSCHLYEKEDVSDGKQ